MYYIIIERGTGKFFEHLWHWPSKEVEDLLEKGHDIIVISTGSNTVKVPDGYDTINGIKEWKWKEYQIPDLYDIIPNEKHEHEEDKKTWKRLRKEHAEGKIHFSEGSWARKVLDSDLYKD